MMTDPKGMASSGTLQDIKRSEDICKVLSAPLSMIAKGVFHDVIFLIEVIMSSVNFMKLKGTKCSAMLMHADSDERMKHTHSNPDIDLTKTSQNVNHTGRSFKEALKYFNDRIDYLDSTTNKNKRKDRVTLFDLEIPAPEGMSIETQRAFLNDVYNLLTNYYGKENIVAAYDHFDEIHDYYDADEKRMRTSVGHMHAFVIPEADGKILGKSFSSPSAMNKLNKAIDEMCQERYGMKFMNGKGSRNKTTEQLKLNSARAAEQVEHEAVAKAEQAKQNLNTAETELTESKQAIAQKKEELAAVTQATVKANVTKKPFSKKIEITQEAYDALSNVGKENLEKAEQLNRDSEQKLKQTDEKNQNIMNNIAILEKKEKEIQPRLDKAEKEIASRKKEADGIIARAKDIWNKVGDYIQQEAEKLFNDWKEQFIGYWQQNHQGTEREERMADFMSRYNYEDDNGEEHNLLADFEYEERMGEMILPEGTKYNEISSHL